MARPRKKAEDLVPDENPLGQLGEAEEAVAAETAEPAAEEAAPATNVPAGEPVAEEPAAADPVAEEPAPEPAAEEPPAAAEPAAAEVAGPADEPAGDAAPTTREKRRSTKSKAEKRAARARRVKPAPRPAGDRKPIVRLPKPEKERGRRKERRGVVVSSAMDKTIVVKVEMVRPDRRYKKVVRRSTKFHAHDERNEANVGDVVRIVETRPLSKTKNWRLAEVIEAAR